MDGELCSRRRMTRLHVPREKRYRKRMVYKWLSRLVTGISWVAVGLLAIPAGILFLLISGIWAAADRITAYWEQKGAQ